MMPVEKMEQDAKMAVGKRLHYLDGLLDKISGNPSHKLTKDEALDLGVAYLRGEYAPSRRSVNMGDVINAMVRARWS